jgi:uncharacterized membrane protein
MKFKNVFSWSTFLLWVFILAYIAYFSYFTVLRYKTLSASYFDLGIMHQTVYNTYEGIIHHDPDRFLELTNPHGGGAQITRMAIHNDVILGLLAIFYFFNNTPSTLVVLQTIVMALGAVAVYKIAQFVFKNNQIIPLVFASAYLMYTPLQRANIFDFHGVALATTFLLFMFYFWLTEKYKLSFLFFVLSVLTKEEIPLVTLFFGLYILARGHEEKMSTIFQNPLKTIKDMWKHFLCVKENEPRNAGFAVSIIILSITYFALTMLYIIPHFRSGNAHFALSYYYDNDSGGAQTINNLLHIDSLRYMWFLLGPLALLSLLSPLHLFIAIPELAINLLSSNWNMHNIIYHYTSAIVPWVFISAIYGLHNLIHFLKKRQFKLRENVIYYVPALVILICTLLFSYYKGPLPYSKEADIWPFKKKLGVQEVTLWADRLKNDNIKVAVTGHAAPLFASRRYLYTLQEYTNADYVVIQKDEVYNGYQKEELIPAYKKLEKDPNYQLIYYKNDIEVYKKVLHFEL